jgi:predicted flavoprotein YhiN
MTTPNDALDCGHVGHLGGYSMGFAHGQRFADEDRAQAIIHAYAAKWTEAAVRTATARHGAGWASEIERACYPDEVA